MTIDCSLLKDLAASYGTQLDDTALSRFDTYAQLLIEWNEKINLTTITEPEEIVYKHFLDSILPLYYVEIPEGASLIDVGTGAGFPGLPLLIARPDLKVTLLDGTRKRLNVIQDIADHLELEPVLVHGRAEEKGRDPKYREKFDFATARAVSGLRTLSEYCLPFIRVNGMFLALKGPAADEELAEADHAISVLGGYAEEPIVYDLEGRGERSLVLITKEERTPKQYPRPAGQMKKKPL